MGRRMRPSSFVTDLGENTKRFSSRGGEDIATRHPRNYFFFIVAKMGCSRTEQIKQAESQLQVEKSTYQQKLQQLEERAQEQIQAKQTEINNLKDNLEQLQQQEQALKLELEETKQKLEKQKPIPLKSDRNVDYTKLRDLLAAGEWKEADLETANVMLQAAGKSSNNRLYEKDIESFPCEDLRTINQLWLKHSNGKFGLSVQKDIYQSLGGTKEYNDEVWSNFCARVGWKKGDEWLERDALTKLDLTLPQGRE